MKCDYCGGDGWYADHDDLSNHEDHGTGEPICVSCPIQRQCEKCQGTGFISEAIHNGLRPQKRKERK